MPSQYTPSAGAPPAATEAYDPHPIAVAETEALTTTFGEGKPDAAAPAGVAVRDNSSSEEDVEASSPRSKGGSASEEADDLSSEPNCCNRSLHAVAHFFNLIVPRGGILSGALNLASVTFGAGIMSYPSAFNKAGLGMAVIYLILVTLFTVFSIALLAEASHKTGLMSFESLARHLFGRGADIFVACVMWLLCFGGASGYVIAVGDIFTTIFSANPSLPDFLHSTWGRRCLQTAVWVLFMLPVSLPKTINSLRYVSLVGIFFIVLFVFSVVGHSAQNAFHNGVRKDLVMFRTGNTAVSALATFIFGYLNQVNAITIAREARPRSVRRMTITAALSCGVCAFLYFLIGFFGYCELGPEVKGNILLYFDPYKDPIFFVCYIGIIVKLIASFSQNMFACRTALFQVLHWDVKSMPYWKHSLVAFSFAFVTFVLGLFVPDINTVFGFVGGFCGGFIGFVFPSLFIMYAGNWSLQSVGIVRWLLTYLLLIVGVIAIVFGTVSTIYDTV